MYAIIETGGKQLKVRVDESIFVEKMDVAEKAEVKFNKVLAIFDGEKLHVGKPFVSGVTITTICQKQGKQKKVIVFKTKQKSNWKTTKGHRQPYTRLFVSEIKFGAKSIKAKGSSTKLKDHHVKNKQEKAVVKTLKKDVEKKVETKLKQTQTQKTNPKKDVVKTQSPKKEVSTKKSVKKPVAKTTTKK